MYQVQRTGQRPYWAETATIEDAAHVAEWLYQQEQLPHPTRWFQRAEDGKPYNVSGTAVRITVRKV